MSMEITFFVENNNVIPNGKSIITADRSILFEPSIPIDAFSIYPYHWSFELTTQRVTQDKYLLQYAMGTLCLINYTSAELQIPKSRRGKIYVSFSSPPSADGIYYNKYSKFIDKKYYDSKNKIFAIGDIGTSIGNCVEFVSGQFAVINDLGELIALYIYVD